MRSRIFALGILAFGALVITLLASTPAASAAGPGTGAQARPSDPEVRAYWTAGRLAGAVSLEYLINARGEVERGIPAGATKGKPPHAGGGGGDDSGSDGVVTGASWTAGGALMDATGRAFFTIGGTDYTCSAALVSEAAADRAVVLTAAHCLFDEVNDEFASYWAFIPNYDLGDAFFTANGGCSAYPTRCWVADRLVAPQGWADGTSSSVNWASDYGFAVFEDETEVANAVPGYFLGSAAPDTSVHAFGYAAAKKYKGDDLVYCAGPTIADPYQPTTNWGLACDMTGGSSGGPWLQGFDAASNAGTLVSVNSYGYRGGPYSGYMFGPLFNGQTQSLLAAAVSSPGGSGDKLVP